MVAANGPGAGNGGRGTSCVTGGVAASAGGVCVDLAGVAVAVLAVAAGGVLAGSGFGGVVELSATGVAFSAGFRKAGTHATLASIAVVTVINFKHRQWLVHCGLATLVRLLDFFTRNLKQD